MIALHLIYDINFYFSKIRSTCMSKLSLTSWLIRLTKWTCKPFQQTILKALQYLVYCDLYSNQNKSMFTLIRAQTYNISFAEKANFPVWTPIRLQFKQNFYDRNEIFFLISWELLFYEHLNPFKVIHYS